MNTILLVVSFTFFYLFHVSSVHFESLIGSWIDIRLVIVYTLPLSIINSCKWDIRKLYKCDKRVSYRFDSITSPVNTLIILSFLFKLFVLESSIFFERLLLSSLSLMYTSVFISEDPSSPRTPFSAVVSGT